jgi:hypothetical protein
MSEDLPPAQPAHQVPQRDLDGLSLGLRPAQPTRLLKQTIIYRYSHSRHSLRTSS